MTDCDGEVVTFEGGDWRREHVRERMNRRKRYVHPSAFPCAFMLCSHYHVQSDGPESDSQSNHERGQK